MCYGAGVPTDKQTRTSTGQALCGIQAQCLKRAETVKEDLRSGGVLRSKQLHVTKLELIFQQKIS